MKKKLTEKQIKLIKMGIPVAIVLLLVLVGGNGLTGLMGNTTFNKDKCICEEGWIEGDNDTCYQENVNTELESAKILGDASGNGEVNAEDFDIIEDALTKEQTYGSVAANTTVELDNIQEAVYDINDDKTVDYNDVIAFNEQFETSTDGKILKEDYQPTYVCPRELVEETNSDNGQTIRTTKTYKLEDNNEQMCLVTTTIRVIKKAVCETNEIGNTSSISPNTEIEEPKYQLNVQTSICTKEECNNDTEIKTRSNDTNMPNESAQSTDVVLTDNGEDEDEE